MPAYSTTAKDVTAPFVKRTAKPVGMGEESVTVFFAKPEKGTGWVAFAGESVDAASATGKTLDGAVDALIERVTAAAGDETGENSAPEESSEGEDVTAEEIPADVPEPVKESRMTGGKLSALVMSAYRESAAGVTDALARKISMESADIITSRAFTVISGLIADARTAGIDADKVERLNTYALGLVSHHDSVVGGSIGGVRMSKAQNKRARVKLASVAASLV